MFKVNNKDKERTPTASIITTTIIIRTPKRLLSHAHANRVSNEAFKNLSSSMLSVLHDDYNEIFCRPNICDLAELNLSAFINGIFPSKGVYVLRCE